MAESFSNRLNVAMAFRNVKQIDFVHAAEKDVYKRQVDQDCTARLEQAMRIALEEAL